MSNLIEPKGHQISDHGFMDCPSKGPHRSMHFNTEDVEFVSYCPWCGESIAGKPT